MSSRLRKLPLVVLALVAVLVLGACGDSHTKVTTGTYAGESGQNAPYLDVGPLKYEVQLSRELNPTNAEDAAYLQGLGAAESKLEPGQEWFAVFVQVYNDTSTPIQSASELTITDTQGNAYTPLVPSQVNPYAYRPSLVPAKGQLPIPDATADLGPSQGALLLYKIQTVSLDNRPLELKIVDPTDPAETASAELDV
ncbi:MAG: hypothetical protein ACYDHN_02590 [Solirubrobacteraceae bacterium]